MDIEQFADSIVEAIDAALDTHRECMLDAPDADACTYHQGVMGGLLQARDFIRARQKEVRRSAPAPEQARLLDELVEVVG